MSDTLKDLEDSAEVHVAPNGSTYVTVDADALAAHVATYDIPSTPIADDDPILAELFGDVEDEDGGDLFE